MSLIPIHQAIGKRIKCPQCGAEAAVKPAQVRFAPGVNPGHAMMTPAWYEVVCPRDGRKLYPSSGPEMPLVEVIEKEASHVR
jgi:hypothetical protein